MVCTPSSASARGFCRSVTPRSDDDLRGGVEPVEHAHERRADVVAATCPRAGRRVPGEPEEVVAFVEGQPERASESSDRLLGRARAAALLESCVEVGRHVRERCDLLAPQAWCAAALAGAEADVVGLQCRAAAAQEVCKPVSVHGPMIPQSPCAEPGTACPRFNWSLVTAAGRAQHGRHDHFTCTSHSSPAPTAASAAPPRSQLARDGVDLIVTYRSHADEAQDVVAEAQELGRKAVALQLDVGATDTFDAFARAVADALRGHLGSRDL